MTPATNRVPAASRRCENFAICNGACPLYWRKLGFDELIERQGFAPVQKAWFER